jgi:hypothetical protein
VNPFADRTGDTEQLKSVGRGLVLGFFDELGRDPKPIGLRHGLEPSR